MLNDIIDKYLRAYNIIESSPNPKTQIAAITDFFKYCEEKNQSHLFSNFIPDFLIHIVNIFRNASVDFIDPNYLIISKHILHKSLSIESDDIARNEIKNLLESINLRLLILYYYTGEIENGKIILQDMLNSDYVKESGVSLEQSGLKNSFKSSTSSLVDPNLFKVSKVFEILRQIYYELNRMNLFSSAEVNILLVESDNSCYGLSNFGIVQSLECSISVNKNGNTQNLLIENIVDVKNNDLTKAGIDIIASAGKIISLFGKKAGSIESKKICLKFRDVSGIYKGTSFGVGASLVISANYLINSNSRIRFLISNSAAFTGSIDSNGNVIKLPEESLITKIEAAFFSWIKFVVIPYDNIPAAGEKLFLLNKKYPDKELKIIGVKNIREIIENSDVIKIEEDNFYTFSKKFIERHKITAFSLMSFILVLLTAFLVWNYIPRKIKPLPELKGNLNMIYTPDRDTVWTFKSTDRLNRDTLFVGEAGLGDMITHKFNLINNDDKKQPLRMEIRGRDKDEFEVVWSWEVSNIEAPEIINAESKQRNIIKFVPYKSAGEKEAELVFYNDDNPEHLKTIYLKGKTTEFKGGYSLRLSGDDEFISNPRRGNLLGNEFTISLWFKTNNTSLSILTSNNSSNTLTKLGLQLSNDSSILLSILRPKSEQTNNIALISKSKIHFNKWNFAALANKGNKTFLILNDEIIFLQTEKNHFQKIEDCFIFGPNTFFTESEHKNYRSDNWELYLAEIRIYNKFLNEQELREKQYSKENYRDDRLVLYYDFEEMVGHFIFDKTNNDIAGELFRLPRRTLDYPPVNTENKSNNNSDACIRIKNKGEVRLNKNLFQPKSSFTVQFDAKAGGNLSRNTRQLFSLSGIDNHWSWNYLYGDSIAMSYSIIPFEYSKQQATICNKLDNKWHRYSFDYDNQTNSGRFYIDGELLAAYDFGEHYFDITRQFYFMLFGKEGVYDNARFIGEECCIDNIAIYGKTLNDSDIKIKNPDYIKSIPGLLAFWDFSNVNNQVSYDFIQNLPIFLYTEFDIVRPE